jgi:hypothetical protein
VTLVAVAAAIIAMAAMMKERIAALAAGSADQHSRRQGSPKQPFHRCVSL